MKINTKDLLSGGILVLLAALGLWLNLDHTLGTARRMGPGYMPMLVFWLLLGLGAMVVIISLRTGPEPLEVWTRLDVIAVLLSLAAGLVTWQLMLRAGLSTNYLEVGVACLVAMLVLSISPPWRPLGLVSASFAIFGLTLEPLGLMLSLALTILVSAFADREHRPVGVIGMIIFLCVLCWFVFIRELDIRVPLWPTIF